MKTNSEMLKSIKSYNKVAREGKAKKEGFMSAATMIFYLEHEISSGNGNKPYLTPTIKSDPIVDKPISSSKTTIHVVDVLDASGSMSGAKYDAAKKGINMGVYNLHEDTANVEYTYTLCDFSNDVIFRHTMSDIKTVDTFKGETRGATALYDAIGDSVALIRSSIKNGDKVLMNIYTDGQENASVRYKAPQISSLIERFSKVGWTFTFIGTKSDVEYAQKQLKFDISNTLVHDNTGAGMERSFRENSVARTSYSKKVELGEDVSKGFYKDIN